MTTYNGSCHCGDIRFSFEHDEITGGLHCNCSICIRKGALMSDFTIPAKDLQIDAKPGALALYKFGSGVAKHYFCKQCGIYPFNETLRMPGHFRVNLGCIDGVDPFSL
ncbi:GFA family protein, partial [Sedimenticola selenatireducens]|uniref:GFA family protein n=1 Tax=Sedimenticola selenatireducens TaxID=191960 RepID=UPI003F4AA68B